jgi:ketosteroid isomerase-like protein
VQPPAAAPAPKVAASAPATKALPPVAASSEAAGQVQEVEAAVAKWAKAWSARDVKSYLAAYGRDFDPPGSVNRKTWEEERQLRITSKASITVKVEGLSVHVSGNHATAKFRQDYKAGGLAVSSRKTLDFAKVGEHWQIVKETVGN